MAARKSPSKSAKKASKKSAPAPKRAGRSPPQTKRAAAGKAKRVALVKAKPKAKVSKTAKPAKPAKPPKPAKPAKPAPPSKKPAKAAKSGKKPVAARALRDLPVEPAAKPKIPQNAALLAAQETPADFEPLHIALFGASGRVGIRIAKEAVTRGHKVTALVRNPDKVAFDGPNVRKIRGDVTDPIQVAIALRNHDIVASAIAPPPQEPNVLVHAASALVTAAKETGKRVVAVGGVGSLEVAPGKLFVDTPTFGLEFKPVALAHRDALRTFQAKGAGTPWTVVSPAADFAPGERTGKFRVGTDQLLLDKKGVSRISMEDYAVAFVDELERGDNVGKRISVAY